ncbi:phosphoenolpyruvate-protein phosphotransferase [Deltaproteobacteria bacterium]|nr:phosphoenolpyruvate-protein phosphotransferase [Deltaproteobacteria bacterium]
MSHKVLHGVAVSAGIAIGKTFFLRRNNKNGAGKGRIRASHIQTELDRLDNAIGVTGKEIEEAQNRFSPDMREQKDILSAHFMICKDPKFLDASRAKIRDNTMTAEHAVMDTVNDIALVFNKLENSYFRERINDVRAIASTIVQHLQGYDYTALPDAESVILLAHNLTPADTLSLPLGTVQAFATEEGGRTGHTVILARSLQIPAVIGINGLEESIVDGDMVILDALRGQILINPDASLIARYEDTKASYASFQQTIKNYTTLPAETRDGTVITVRGNIEMPRESRHLLQNGGEGVGLYRTEFGFITRSTIPSEGELYTEYTELLKSLPAHKVTFRTLDIGADKMHWSQNNQEANPALGLRGIRFCLRNQHVFRRQMRAILRASAHGSAALLFPFISGIRELRLAKSILNEVKRELDAANIPYDHNLPLGIMIELPSAVLAADDLAREVDFFSIGTNDLIQYTLGIDRVNRHVAYLYQPLHPAIIRSIKLTADAARRAGIALSVCGEMASDPYCLAILMGMDIHEFSMAPQAIPGIKHVIRNLDMDECRHLLRQAVQAATADAVNRIAKQALSARFAGELPFYLSVLDTEK